MAIPLFLILFFSGGTLLTIGIVFAFTRKNRLWHIMTGGGAALLITGIVLICIIASGITGMVCCDSYNNGSGYSGFFNENGPDYDAGESDYSPDQESGDYSSGYRNGYADGFEDGLEAASELFSFDSDSTSGSDGRYHNYYEIPQNHDDADNSTVPDTELSPQEDDDYFIGDFLSELIERIFELEKAETAH